jgi:general secretion pathway protein G
MLDYLKEHKLMPGAASRGIEGFTLVELLVVLGIIALLAALVAPQVIGYMGGARADSAKAQLRNIESAIELYYLDTGEYPPQEPGLDALVAAPADVKNWRGPYIKKREGLVDPWGKRYQYRQPGEHGDFDLSSMGRDGREGGEEEDADIVNW